MGTTSRLVWVIALLGSVLLVSCGGETTVQDPAGHVQITQEREAGIWHCVQGGENLRLIAERYYGSGHHWRLIQVSNDVGSYPKPGSNLWIPASIDAWFAEQDLQATLVTEVHEIETSDSVRPRRDLSR